MATNAQIWQEKPQKTKAAQKNIDDFSEAVKSAPSRRKQISAIDQTIGLAKSRANKSANKKFSGDKVARESKKFAAKR